MHRYLKHLLGTLCALSAGYVWAQTPAGPPPAGGPAAGMAAQAPKEAPASYVAPTDPRILSGMWVPGMRGINTLPVIKASYLDKFPQGTEAPGQATLDNKHASSLCIPDGYFGTGGGYPNVVIQTDSQITIINEENHRFRRIYLDNRKPATIKPSYAGFSLGHWEGNTLVVETTHIKQRVDSAIVPPNFRIVENFKRSANGRSLEYTVRFFSDAYEQPGQKLYTWTWRPDLHIQEQVCEENSDNFNSDYKFK